MSASGTGRGYPIGEESLLANPDSCPTDGDHFRSTSNGHLSEHTTRTSNRGRSRRSALTQSAEMPLQPNRYSARRSPDRMRMSSFGPWLVRASARAASDSPGGAAQSVRAARAATKGGMPSKFWHMLIASYRWKRKGAATLQVWRSLVCANDGAGSADRGREYRPMGSETMNRWCRVENISP